jgi:hypothetical protein
VSGIVVALVKYTGDDSELAARLFNGDLLWLIGKFIGYAAVPIGLGAVGGWISDETKVHKIFWVAISAPVIIAAAASGGVGGGQKPTEPLPIGKAGWNFEQLLPITPAYAESGPLSGAKLKSADGAENPFVEGLKLFFGQKEYRVVVHSVLDDKEKAEAVANRINREFEKQLPAPAAVGERKPFNRYWPVVINGWTTYAEAKKIKDSISDLDFRLDDKPYISVR